MRITTIILILALVLIVACERVPSEPDVIIEAECVSDDDCVTGGCSGTVCQSKDSEPVFTTCEFLPEYACYAVINCGCINGKCQWDKTDEFNRCVAESKEVPMPSAG